MSGFKYLYEKNVSKFGIQSIFGWNALAWNQALKRAISISNVELPNKCNILEIGAGPSSTISLILDDPQNIITVGYYNKNYENRIKARLDFLPLESVYYTKLVDINYIEGKFDVILIKSVLGGLFRSPKCAKQQINTLVKKIVHQNLNSGGLLITLDNGSSLFEKLINSFGARKNKWYFFKLGTLEDQTFQTSFGFLSAFSVTTRLGPGFKFVEDFIYYFDYIMYFFTRKNPTVICNVYKN